MKIEFMNGLLKCEENEIILEYYDKVSDDSDSQLLNKWTVCIFKHDRGSFPPHCHILKEGYNIEISLLNWDIVNIKHNNQNLPKTWDSIDSDTKKGFFKWLNNISVKEPSKTNKQQLYAIWDSSNSDNKLEKWVDAKDNIDKELREYLNLDINYTKLSKDIISFLSEIYYSSFEERKIIHNLHPQELLDYLCINLDVRNDEKAKVIIKQAESNVYDWTFNQWQNY